MVGRGVVCAVRNDWRLRSARNAHENGSANAYPSET